MVGQCLSGGRMAVRRELVVLTGPQEEHTDSPGGALSLNSLCVILGQFFLGDF